jgi:rod shape-determining protein MreC
MRNLFRFLVRYHLFLLFLVAQVWALTSAFRVRPYHQSYAWNTAQNAAASVQKVYTDAKNYTRLRKINRDLAHENAALRARLSGSRMDETIRKGAVQDSLQSYTFQEAEVINASFHKRSNYLTINRGFNHGVRPGQGVISPRGVVGVVHEVSKHYATVIPILHRRTRLSGSMARTKHFGSVLWEGGNHRIATMVDVARQANVKKGDWVLSDTRSGLFPSGIKIGQVKSFALDPSSQSFVLDVALSVDFAALQTVYVVENLYKKERRALEVHAEPDTP